MLKLIAIKIDGIRKLRAVEIRPKEIGVTEIHGKNEAGKTSVIDALQMLFMGDRFKTQDMVTHGADSANIEATMGKYVVKKIITPGGASKLEVKMLGDDGVAYTRAKPQDFLNSVINDLTFDPRPFLTSSTGDKMKKIMNILSLDFTEQDMKLAQLGEERKVVGRELKRMEVPNVEPDKAEAVDTTELIELRKRLESENAKALAHAGETYNKKAQEVITNNERVKAEVKHKENLAQRIALLKADLASLQEEHDNIKGEILEMPVRQEPALHNLTEIDQKMQNADSINKRAAVYSGWKQKREAFEAKEKEHSELTLKIESLREDKLRILRETPMPIPGLEIKEDGLYLNGIHCENWSEAQGLKASLDLCAAMKPELQAIFLDKGESFDSDNMATLQQWAVDHNIQVIITVVDDLPENMPDADNIIWIEEGEVIHTGK